MRTVCFVLATITACTYNPGRVVNRHVPATAQTPRDAQLVFQKEAGVRVLDLKTGTSFALGPAGFQIADVTDDASVLVMSERFKPVLWIAQPNRPPATLVMPHSPVDVRISPSGRYVAGSYYSDKMTVGDALFVIDLQSMTVTQVPAKRSAAFVMKTGWTADSSAFIVETDAEGNWSIPPEQRIRTLAYTLGVGWGATTATPTTTRYTREQDVDAGGPDVCVTPNGERVDGDWRRLADIRGIKHHPRAHSPVRLWGFFADCSLHVVHDQQLWIVDNERRATLLGTVELSPRPMVFAGGTFSPQR